jgi:hypothetical protein
MPLEDIPHGLVTDGAAQRHVVLVIAGQNTSGRGSNDWTATLRKQTSSNILTIRHQGAPEATQVADRFHLLQNMAEALDQVFTTHGTALDAVDDALRQHPMSLPDGAVTLPVPPSGTSTIAHQRAAQRQVRRQTTYDHVWALCRQGWTVSAIAQHVGISPRTVQRALQTATLAGTARPP